MRFAIATKRPTAFFARYRSLLCEFYVTTQARWRVARHRSYHDWFFLVDDLANFDVPRCDVILLARCIFDEFQDTTIFRVYLPVQFLMLLIAIIDFTTAGASCFRDVFAKCTKIIFVLTGGRFVSLFHLRNPLSLQTFICV